MLTKKLSFYAGVFLISGFVMALQILQSRIFSVTSWYHLSFLVISMAMFGMTLGALKIYRMNEAVLRAEYGLVARRHTVYFSLFILVGLIFQLFIPIISNKLLATLVTLPIAAIATSAAYYHAGVVISLCLTRSPYPAGKVYGADLLGAGAGCILALAMMETIDTPSAVLLLSALAGGTAFLFQTGGDDVMCIGNKNYTVRKAIPVLCAVALLSGIGNLTLPTPIFYPLWVKDHLLTMNDIRYEEWNSISRVTVLNEKIDADPWLWGPSPIPLMANSKVTGSMLVIDGDAGTPITKFDGDFTKHKYLEYDVTNLAYAIPGIKNAAIIGVGGGRDLLSAKYFGVENVTALDVNPVQIKLLRDHPDFKDYAGLYKLSGVKILNEEARSWFRRNDQKLDLVQMSLIDTWAATGAGAFALSENGLYTVEAWSIFMNDLGPDGVFTVSRWSADTMSDTGRLFSVAMATLFKQGVTDARRHIVLAHSGNIVTLILSKTPFADNNIFALRHKAEKMQYDLIVAPDQPLPQGLLGELMAAHNTQDLYTIASRQYFDVSPSTDMRPFFFNQARITQPLEIIKMSFSPDASGVSHGQAKATLNLFIIIGFSIVMVAAVILLPLLRTVENKTSPFILAGTLYFSLIGLGFMLIEISLLQALGVFLGHPIYGLGVLLFSLILSAGIGSFLSGMIPLRNLGMQLVWCACVCAYAVTLSMLLSGIFDTYAEASIIARIMVSILIIAPAGVLMGFGFPTGLALAEKFDSRASAWFWGINGAAGVLGSSLAIALNIAFGIDKTLVLGGGCYALLSVAFVIFALSVSSSKLGMAPRE